MAVSFNYYFNAFFFTDLAEGIFLVLVYLMFILSAKKQPQERSSAHLLKIAGIIGIIFSVIYVCFPTMICSPPDFEICSIYGFFTGLFSIIPMLVCLGVLLMMFGKHNKDSYGRILMISGILWIVSFVGYFFTILVIAFELWMLTMLGAINILIIPDRFI